MRLTLAVIAAIAAAAAGTAGGTQILSGPAGPSQPVGPGIEARAGVPSIVGSAPVSTPKPTTLRRDDAATDARCQQDGPARTAARAADGQVHCVDPGQVGRLR